VNRYMPMERGEGPELSTVGKIEREERRQDSPEDCCSALRRESHSIGRKIKKQITFLPKAAIKKTGSSGKTRQVNSYFN